MQGPLPVLEVNVAILPRSGFPVRIRATTAECEQVARACGIKRIDRLDADVDIARWRGGGVKIRGRLRADIEQDCVVTLEPVPQQIAEEIEATFLPEGSKLAHEARAHSDELVIDPDGADVPEVFSGDVIDIWPVVVEFLVLAMDPYPRAPGAELDPSVFHSEDAESGPESPFSALRNSERAVPETPDRRCAWPEPVGRRQNPVV